MPSLQDMALVDLGDGKGPRHIPGVSWDPVTRLYDAHITDPHGRYILLGGYEEPRKAVEAIQSMTETFARWGGCTNTIVGGPKPVSQIPNDLERTE